MALSEHSKNDVSRRSFLRGAGLGLGLPALSGLLAACSNALSGTQTNAGNVAVQHSEIQHTAPTVVPDSSGSAADKMDAMHQAGVDAFVAGVKTQGLGNQLLEPTMDGDIKVFELTASVIQWETDAGKLSEAWAYNGQVPGPMIRATQGDRVRIVLKNELPESTSIHPHGLLVTNPKDGVPGITQKPVKPGETYIYEFTVRNSGSHMYHSHHNAAKQIAKGLLGTFIIDPKDPAEDVAYDVEAVLVLHDQLGGFTLNGKSFPATAPISAKLGQKLRIRYFNQGLVAHPMHLHGLAQEVIARDGYMQPAPWKCDTINVAPGERWDVIVDCDEPGVWAFHCHILNHAESEHGMFGMVTAVIVS
jgi:FtsP/CotA-like multicopper oxidase with cupredoxin domain